MRLRAWRSGIEVVVVLVVTVLWGARAAGQDNGVTVCGRITGESSAAVGGASVSFTGAASGETRRVVANGSGDYCTERLATGAYSVKVEASGWETLEEKLSVGEGAKQVENFVLRAAKKNLGSAEGGGAGAVVGAGTVREMPLNGRSASDAATLEPGVSSARTQPAGATAQRGYGNQITISGGRPRQNDSRQDGISVNDYANSPPGSAAGVDLGVDAVEQVSVLASDYPAQYGNSSGGIVSTTTRAGTNKMHGSVFEFARNSVFDARNYFDLTKPPFQRNQFGGTLGGSVWKERTFYFGAYEGFRQSLGISQVTTVPTAAARAGQLSTGVVAVDSAVLSFLNAFYPLPNGQVFASGDTGLFNFSGQQVTPENYFNTRVDQVLTGADKLTVTYMHDSATVRQPDEFNNIRTGYDSERQLLSLKEVHALGRSAVNSARFGISRTVATTGLSFAGPNPKAESTEFGSVPGENAPLVALAGLTAFTGGVGTQSNYHFHWTSIQFYDDFSVVAGKHTLKAGVEVMRSRDNVLGNSNPGGSFAFNSLADLLTNRPYSLSATVPGSATEKGLRQWIVAGYAEDQWKVAPGMTLDFGLRYEVASVPMEVHNELAVLRNLTDAEPHVGAPLFANPTLRNVEPRVGLSWDPFRDGKSSVGAGFGIFDVLPLPYLFQFGELYTAPFYRFASSTNLPQGSFPQGAFEQISGQQNSLREAYFEPHPPRSYVMQWNLSLQRQLDGDFAATIAYVGSRSVHQPLRSEDADIVLPVLTRQGYLWPQPVGSGARLNPNAGRITAAFWRSDAYYDALEMQLKGKLRRANVMASYTWGKTIDTSSGSIVGDEYGNSISSPLWFNPAINRGLADFNVAQLAEVNYTVDLGRPVWLGVAGQRVLGGWQWGGVLQASTGVPFTPTIGGDALGLNSTDPAIDVPDLVAAKGCGSLTNPGNPLHYIRTQCLAVPNPITLRGDLGRNTAIGPGLMTLDTSLIKNIAVKKVSGDFDLQLRAEFFNVLNHANFAPPLDNRNVFSPTGDALANAGVITSTQTPSREIQFAVKAMW